MPEPRDPDPLTDEQRLDDLLKRREPRFFRAGKGKARGRTGTTDIEAFVDNLSLLQDCSVRMGNQLEMDTVSHCVVYEKDATTAYRYDADSNPRQPMVVGALVNRQMPVREILRQLGEL